jgi:pyruvate kinase
LPGKDIDFPSLIQSDINQLDTNCKNKVDYIGLSFVRSAHDVELLRSELLKREMNAQIIAKVESQPALDRLDEIIESADAIMIARGDLGIEVPFEQLAHWQRVMIDKCRLAHKPVITATEMLESMINNPRPTRAEVTDVAHAVFDGTDAIMLSGESATGKYPVRTVQTMARIAKWNEKLIKTELHFDETDPTNTISNAVASTVVSKIKPKIDAVLVFTETGYTARAISKHRLPVPIIAATDEVKTAELLTLSYGVSPVITDLPEGPFDSARDVITRLVKKDIIHAGNTIIVVHGQHWQKPGNTNSLSIITL